MAVNRSPFRPTAGKHVPCIRERRYIREVAGTRVYGAWHQPLFQAEWRTTIFRLLSCVASVRAASPHVRVPSMCVHVRNVRDLACNLFFRSLGPSTRDGRRLGDVLGRSFAVSRHSSHVKSRYSMGVKLWFDPNLLWTPNDIYGFRPVDIAARDDCRNERMKIRSERNIVFREHFSYIRRVLKKLSLLSLKCVNCTNMEDAWKSFAIFSFPFILKISICRNIFWGSANVTRPNLYSVIYTILWMSTNEPIQGQKYFGRLFFFTSVRETLVWMKLGMCVKTNRWMVMTVAFYMATLDNCWLMRVHGGTDSNLILVRST